MYLTPDIKDYLNRSVLCWLATASTDGIPNVSPKEVFCAYDEDKIIIANIASPQSSKNIKKNAAVCLSFVDVLVQKGYQLKGKAEVITESSSSYSSMQAKLLELTQGKFPFREIFCIEVQSSKLIQAPSYLLFPETSEEDQIAAAKRSYGLD